MTWLRRLADWLLDLIGGKRWESDGGQEPRGAEDDG